MTSHTLLTGGAPGADTVFAQQAKQHQHEIKAFSFDDHNTKQQEGVVVLNQKQLDYAYPFLKIANKTLKRKIPDNDSYVYKLLARNYYQIKTSQQVYAVARLTFEQQARVVGGTAWAVQMAINYNIPVLLFDMHKNRWMKWNDITRWSEATEVPKFPERYTGIGSRDLSQKGVQAIVDLYNQ